MNFFNQILTYIAVIEERSFTAAATRLFITTTAVSKQIKLLEQKIGAQLIERDTRNMRVTDLGERFYLHCKRISTELSAAEDFIQHQQEEPRGLLRVFCSFVSAEIFLIKYLQTFRRSYPLIELHLELGDYFPDMDKENYDIVVGFSMLPQIPTHLRYRKLFTSHYILVAAPDYLKKFGVPITPADIKSHLYINHPLRRPTNLIQFNDGTEIHMSQPGLIINNITALLQVCIDGGGIMLVSDLQARQFIKEGTLTQILPHYPLSDVSIYLFYKSLEYEQKKVLCFIDYYTEKTKHLE